MATLTDPGKLIQAKLPGNCAECGGDIVPGASIYFSRLHGSRHKKCVEPGEPAPAPAEERAAPPPSDAPRAAPGGARDDGWLWAEGDAAPRDAYAAPARATEFGRAGDRDAARRELGGVLDLLIDALQRARKLLA